MKREKGKVYLKSIDDLVKLQGYMVGMKLMKSSITKEKLLNFNT